VPRFSFLPVPEAGEVGEDIERLFDELATVLPAERRVQSGEFRPPLDVFDTEGHVEIVVDVPGVNAAAIRVAFRGGVLLVVGEKTPQPVAQARVFHLVEREFGRFVRAVRVTGAVDVGKARAQVKNGELSIVLPKITDRRGQIRRIPVDDGSTRRP
jgi:HSP20 family protein